MLALYNECKVASRHPELSPWHLLVVLSEQHLDVSNSEESLLDSENDSENSGSVNVLIESLVNHNINEEVKMILVTDFE
jgi:hypothetical protein